MVTVFDRGVAFVNEFIYRKANVRETGSFISMVVESSGCKVEGWLAVRYWQYVQQNQDSLQ